MYVSYVCEFVQECVCVYACMYACLCVECGVLASDKRCKGKSLRPV